MYCVILLLVSLLLLVISSTSIKWHIIAVDCLCHMRMFMKSWAACIVRQCLLNSVHIFGTVASHDCDILMFFSVHFFTTTTTPV